MSRVSWVLLALVSACAEVAEPPPSDATPESTATERLVVLGGGATEIVYALGHEVVATDKSAHHPPEAVEKASLGYYRQVQAEGILAQQPSLVLASAGTGPQSTLDQLRAAGIRVVDVPEVTSLTEARSRVALIAGTLGEPDAGEALVATMDADLAAVRSRVADAPRPRVLFLYARGGGAMFVAGRDTAVEAVVDAAGGTLAAADHDGFAPLTAEAVVQAAPDVLLLTSGGLEAMGGEAGVLAAPGVSATPAGAAARVVALPDDLLLGMGPRVGEAADTLARALHPELSR